jgi:hypothetical protein
MHCDDLIRAANVWEKLESTDGQRIIQIDCWLGTLSHTCLNHTHQIHVNLVPQSEETLHQIQ